MTTTTTTTRTRTSAISSDRGARILFATDGSPGATVALEFLGSMPLRPDDEIIVVTYPSYFLAARPDQTGLIGKLMEGRRRAAQATADETVQRLAGSGARVSGVVAQGLEAVDAILRVAAERSPDLLVMGSRGLGPVSSVVVGSTARTLALMSPVPVLMVRGRGEAVRRVLVAVDGSEASRAALSALARLPLTAGVIVELLHVLPAHDWSGLPIRGEELAELREAQERAEIDAADRLLLSSAKSLPEGVEIRTAKERGAVADTIRAHADALNADLIVLGSRGLGGPRRPFWGSTAEHVIVTADRSVLLAPVQTTA